MKIQVSQENIEKGTRGAVRSCPIALAMLEAFPSAKIAVDWDRININDRYFNMPYEAQRFAYAFDYGLTVTPFDFEMPDAIP